MSNTNETQIFNIRAENAVSTKEIFDGGIDLQTAQARNVTAITNAIIKAMLVRGTVVIPNEIFPISGTINISKVNYVKIVNQGILEVAPLTDAEVEIVEGKPKPKPAFKFQRCDEVYYEGRGKDYDSIRSSHANDTVEYNPEDCSRVNKKSSMRVGVSVIDCPKVEITNAKFVGLESAVRVDKGEYPNPSFAKDNENITIRNITTEDTSKPIFASYVKNLTIENVNMISRTGMGSKDHFIHCSNNVKNVYIGGNNTFVYSDYNFGSAINLCNDEETTESVKHCLIENATVTGIGSSFVSAKSDTEVVCNNCIINTTSVMPLLNGDESEKTECFISTTENAVVHLYKCEMTDNSGIYSLANFVDNVKIFATGGKYTNLKTLGSLTSSSSVDGNSILLNVIGAEIETKDAHLFADVGVPYNFNAQFISCTLSTKKEYLYQSKSESCSIYCYDCTFKHTGTVLPQNAFVAYLSEDTDLNPETAPVAVPLLDNIRIVNCVGKQISDVCYNKKYGNAIIYGNEFTYTTTDGTTVTNP